MIFHTLTVILAFQALVATELSEALLWINLLHPSISARLPCGWERYVRHLKFFDYNYLLSVVFHPPTVGVILVPATNSTGVELALAVFVVM